MNKTKLYKTRQNAPGAIGRYLPTVFRAGAALQSVAKALRASLSADHRQLLTNHAGSGTETVWGALCNAFHVQTVADGDWVQISPYGDFPHPKGLQRVDQATCQVMVNDFNSVASRLANLFRGLPFYIGHPDGPPPICNNWPDKSAYGWIKKLEARADGFYALVKWNPGGQDIITNSKFMYVSPAWYPKAVGRDGSRNIVAPVVLKSVGFVNDPNIPVAPIANSADFAAQAQELISNAITEGRIGECSRDGWIGLFALDFENAKVALENYGTSAGAKKGWDTRGRGKASAKTTAKTVKSKLAKAKKAHSVAVRTAKQTGEEQSQAADAHLGLRKNASAQTRQASAARLSKANDDHDAATTARISARNGLDKAQQTMDRSKAAGSSSLHDQITAAKAAGEDPHGSTPPRYGASKTTPPPLPKVGTPEREALQRSASAKVAASSYKASGHTSIRQTTANEDHEAFMQ